MTKKKAKPAKNHPWKLQWEPKNPTPYLLPQAKIPKSAKMGVS